MPTDAFESVVNTTTTGSQAWPDIVTFPDGSYIVVWGALNLAGESGSGIVFQRYDAQGRAVHADGVTLGVEEVHVNATLAGDQGYPRIAAMADGRFMVVWNSLSGQDGDGEGIYAQLFGANGVAIGGEIQVAETTAGRQADPSIVATASGFVVSWASNTGPGDNSTYRVYAQKFDASGAFVNWDGSASGGARAETLVNTSTGNEQGWDSVTALADGHLLALYGSRHVDGSVDIFAKLFNADGTVARDEFQLNSYVGSEQIWPAATQLADGRVAIVWSSYGEDGSGYGVYGRILSADGTILTPEFQVNTMTGGDQSSGGTSEGARIVATADGGFVVAWEGGDNHGYGVYYQRFDHDGQRIGQEHLLNTGDYTGYQYGVNLAATDDGFRAVWHSEDVDGSSYGIVQREVGLEGLIVRTGGEDLVNTRTNFNQTLPQAASAADGSYVVVWVSETAYNAGDGSGTGLFAQRYAADGTRLGSEFQVNQTTAGAQPMTQYGLAQLDNGKFIVVWDDSNKLGDSDQLTLARIFNADGTPATAEFRVNTSTSGEQDWPTVSALHGDNAGGFVVTWRTYFAPGTSYYDIWSQRYDAAGNKVGGEVLVTTGEPSNGDFYEHQGRVVGLSDGGWMVAWQDSGADGSGDALYAKRFDKDGNVVAGTNYDGSPATGAFRVNVQPDYDQYLNANGMAALKDGGFVITFSSQNSDQSGTAVWAQVYNADGTLRGAQFRVNEAQYGTQADPQVTVLADGSFVVVWTSEQPDNSDSWDVYAKRYAADGTVLNSEFQVDLTHDVGAQRWPTVTATPDGFVVAWEHETSSYGQTYDGMGSSIWSQHFTVDSLNAAAGHAADAHTPGLVLAAAEGAEDSAIALSVTAALGAGALGSEHLSVSIGGIPVGATLADGHGHSFTATAGQTGIDVSGWTLSALTITPPPDSESDFTLRVTATSTDSVSHDTASHEGLLTVTVDARPDGMEFGGRSERVNSFTDGDQRFDMGGDATPHSPVASWADGSYVVVWQSYSQDGSDWGVYGQRYDASGQPVGTEFQVNLTTAGAQGFASVATLADGRFVVTWSSFGQVAPDSGSTDPYYSYYDVYSRVFSAGGVGGAVTHVNATSPFASSQYASDITALSDGGWLISWQSENQDGSNYGVYAQRYNAAGAAVHRDGTTAGADEFRVNTATANEQSWVSIEALPAGGWVASWTSQGQDGSGYGVYLQRYDGAGNAVGAETLVNQTTNGNQERSTVTVLKDGGFVVLWQSDVADGSSWAVQGRVFNADGAARGDEFLVNTVTSSDQSEAQAVALADGGFYVAWHGQSQDMYGYGVFGQRFDSEGDRVGGEVPLDPARTYGEQTWPFLAAVDGGFVAVWQGSDPGNDGYWGDGSGWGIFGTRFQLDTTPMAPTGGETQVNTKSAHDQDNPAVATLSDGSYVVVWQSAPSRGTGDISGNGVFAQHYSAAGVALGSEFTVNTTLTGDQSKPQIVAIDGGGYVVVWESSIGDGSGWGVFAQRFDAAGARVGGEFQVNSDAPGNQHDPQVTALHGANAGGFVVTWHQDNGTVEARVFDASGNPVGADITVEVQNPALNGPDSSEYLPDVTGTADGGFVIVWRDSDTDGYGSGVFGQRFGVSLSGGTVTRLGGFNPDGSAAADNFRVNFQDYGYQYDPKVEALAGGGFVVVFISDVADSSGQALVAQRFDAAGHRLGSEFVVASSVAGNQSAPDIVALADGSYIVTWQSDHNDGADGYDVFAKRFAADGHVLNEEFRVNTDGAGFQGDPVVTPVGDGFTVVWTSAGQDGSGDGVFQQHFTFDQGPGSGAVADRPALTVADAAGDEDTTIPLPLDAHLTDADGSETLTVEISGIPLGARLSDGTHSFTADAAHTAVDVAGWNLSQLTITPAHDADDSFTLDVRAASRETASGDIAWNTDQIHVTVNPVAEPQAPYNDEFQINQTTSSNQYDPHVAAFANGDFVVVWSSSNQPGGYADEVVARLYNADGTPKGAEFVVNTYHDWYEQYPDVTVLADGGFIVSWNQLDANGGGIFAQRFDASGARLTLGGAPGGQPSQINDTVASDQFGSEITALADGGFIVTWRSYNQEGGAGANTQGIYAKHYAADGSVVPIYDAAGVPHNEALINVTLAGDQSDPSVVQLAGGGFAVSWNGPDSSGSGLYVRVYDASGHPVTALGTDGEMLVNSTTGSEQYGAGGILAALADGGFVVSWQSYGQDGSNYGIYGQVYNADGTTRGGEFHVSSYAYDNQQEPQVTSLPDGGFMVTWTSANQDGDNWGVYAQRFDATGDQVGSEFRVSQTIPGDQSSPAIAVQPDGSGVVVVFEGQDGDGYGVYGNRLPLPDAATELAIDRAGVEQQVNSYTTSDQSNPSVTKLADGSYVVTWQSNGQDGSSWGVYAKHFDADGDAIQLTDGSGNPLWVTDGNGDPVLAPDGQGNMVQVPLTEFQVNSYTNSEQRTPTIVPTADGGFLVLFQSYGNSSAGDGDWGVYARRYDAAMHQVDLTDAAGNPVGELRINGDTPSTQDAVKAALLSDGRVIVTWEDDHADGSSWGVYSRIIGADGHLAGGPDTLVGTTTDNQQIAPSVAALADGGWVITWSSYTHDGSDWGVYGQQFNADGSPHGQEFLVNTETDAGQIYSSVTGLSDGGYVVAWQTYTNADSDNSGWGIAGQRYDADGHPVGDEFLINGIAYQDQTGPTIVAAPDGGFVVAWNSYQADGSGWGVVARRFDAQGHATDPYGDDILINSYSAGDQTNPALAMLERGFVAVWQSYNQDGSGTAIEMQRFQGQGLEPPPLYVDAAHGGDSNSDLVFSTVAEALAAATDGDTIILKGGTYNLSATAVVTQDDLHIKNAAGETVVINGPAGGPAIQVGAGLNISLKGDAANHLTINGGAGSTAAVDFLGTNSGTEIFRVTINANGDYGLRFGGGQNGVSVSDSVFGGTAGAALVLVRGTASGVAGSTGVNIVDNIFSGTGGSGLVSEATGSEITENTFSGTWALAHAALVVHAAGDDIQDNVFSGHGPGAWFYDLASAYDDGTIVGQNAFPAGWTRVVQRDGVFTTLTEALATAQANDTVYATAGAYAGETGLTVAVDNLTLSAPAGATGIALTLGSGVATFTLADNASVQVTGNGLANVINGAGGDDTFSGGAGNDQLNGGSGADHLNGDAGADLLYGDSGDDVMAGGADDDRYIVYVGQGHDTVTDTSGNDVLDLRSTNFGSNDSLVLSGSAGSVTATFDNDASVNVTASGIEAVEVTLDNNDSVTLTGAIGAQTVAILGGAGSNTVDASGLSSATAVTFTGGRGADSFIGSSNAGDTVDYSRESDGGNVTVNLAAGTATDTHGDVDTLSGVENVITGAGNDSITGSSAANRIEAGAGDDAIAGGGGVDSFIFRAGFGHDTIGDFAPATETLRFDAAVFGSVAAVLAAASASGGNTVITAPGGATITLTGVTPGQLGAWNIDILGQNDAPTLRATAPGALREAGQGVAGTASSSVTLTAADVDGTVSYDATALAAGGWVQGPAGVWTHSGTYGQAVLTLASNSLVYQLDDTRPATQGLQTGDTVSEAFTVPVIDNNGATATRTVTYSIGGSNDAPVGVVDTGTAVEAGVSAGSAATGNVLTNDTDVDTVDSKAVSAVTGGTVGGSTVGAHGTLTLNADGSYSYAVNNADTAVQALRTSGQTLTDAFTYTVRDAAGATSQTTLTITIQGQNDAPVGVADTASATEAGTSAGTNPIGNVLTNDTDVDSGDSKTVSAVTGGTVGQALTGAHGSLTLNADGSYSYAVNNADPAVDALRTSGDTLTDSFTYTVRDAAGATSTATLTVTLHGANDAPTAVVDMGTAVEAGAAAGSAASGNVLTNDTDVDAGDSKTVSAVTGGAVGAGLAGTYGTLTLNANGAYSYIVDDSNPTVQALRTSGQTLTDSFTYTMRDAAGATSSSTLTITIQGQNDAPVGAADTGSATEAGAAAGSDATGNVLTNDTDVDAGDSKTVSAITGGAVGGSTTGAHGTLTLNADGTYSYAVNNADGAVNALRTSGDTLTDSFTYTVRDTAGATSTATLTVTIHGANDAPVAVADTAPATEAGTAAGSNPTGNVLTNDTDVDTGDSKTVSAIAGGTVGQALAGAHGSLTLNADGSYSYVVNNADPAVDALRTSGETLTDSFTYTVRDAAGATSQTTLTVTLHGANDAPIAGDDAGSASKSVDGDPIDATGNVLGNDTDVDSGDSKVVSALSGGTVGQALTGQHGTLTLNADGTYDYVVNQSDPAVVALRPTDSIQESFTYTVRDTAGATDTAVLTITIFGANEAPTAVADTGSATETGTSAGSGASGNVLTNDTDPDADDTQAVTAVKFGATSGTLGSALAGAHGSLTLNADGTYSYAVNDADPAVNALRTSGETLTDVFTYTMRDAAGATSSTTLTITIHGADDAPVAVADTGTAVETGTSAGSGASGSVLTNDTDVDAGDSKTVSAVTGGAVGGSTTGAHGTLTLNADGSYSYAVNDSDAAVQALRNSGQTLTDTFTYTVRDTAGATSQTSLTITIQGANDAPVGVADTASATEDAAGPTGNVLTNDTDPDAGDSKTVSAVAGGAVGSPLTGAHGTLTLNADGSYSYAVNNADPAVDALRTSGQTLTDSFTYTVRDTAGATGAATLTVTIHGANDAPHAVADTGAAVENGAVAGSGASGNVLTNDTDVDAGDSKAVTAIAGGTVGAGLAGSYGTVFLNADGSYSYAVDNGNATVQALRTSGQTLTDSFTYTMRDAAGATSSSTLTITIQGANDAPVGVADTASATEDATGPTGNVLANDTDVDAGDSKTVSAVTGGTVGGSTTGAHGTLTLNADGSYSYAVNNADGAVNALRTSGDTLTDSFTYTVRDTAGATSTATLTVTIHGANDAPVAVADTASANENGAAATGNVLTNDTDVDAGDSRTVSAVAGGAVGQALTGAHGTLTLNADGSYSYAVNNADPAVDALRTSGDTLTDSFTYTVRDAAGATSQTTLTVTIHGANDAPHAVADTGAASMDPDGPPHDATGNVLGNDTDVDSGDSKAVSAVTGGTVGGQTTGAHGTLTLNADGAYSYTPNSADPAVAALGPTDSLTDSFTYTVRDTAGATSQTTLTITVFGANEVPTAVADTVQVWDQGAPGAGNVLTNDTDPDAGDSKTVTVVKHGAATGTVGSALTGDHGTLTLNADGSYSYVIDGSDAAVGALGGGDTLTDSFTYTMRDTAGATSTTSLTVTIHGANNAPDAVADTGSATEGGPNGSGNVLTNDTDPDSGDSKTVSAVSGGTVGAASSGSYGTLTLGADGGWTYVVDASNVAVKALGATQTLTDTFTYTVQDAAGATDTATLSITVHGLNDAPTLDLQASRGGNNTIVPFGESTGAVAIAPADVVIDDADDATISGAVIRLTNPATGDRLGIGNAAALAALGITASAYNTANGTITLSGVASHDAYEQALHLVTFNNTNASPQTGDRTVTVTVSDGAATSLVATSTIQVTGRLNLTGGVGNDVLVGGAGGDSISGGGGDDTLRGNGGNDTLKGEAGKDILWGGDGDDKLFGGDDNDTLQGEAGNDTLSGDAGDDKLFGGAGIDTLTGGLGNDTVSGGDDNDTVKGDAGDDTVNGDGGDDKLYGGDGSDRGNGGDGNDQIFGEAGDDTLSGNAGDDTLNGSLGADKLYGGDGADKLLGGDDNDQLQGDAGNDTLTGDAGDDKLFGGDGDDSLNGGIGNDFIRGDAGVDKILGGDGDDDLAGGADNDTLGGGIGADLIKGDAGDDSITGDAGADRLYGGDGADKIYGGDDNDQMFGEAGDDFVSGQNGDDVLWGADGLDSLYGGDGGDQIHGGADADLVSGDAGNDMLYGDDGADKILGGTGDDYIVGGLGTDTLTGGTGNDRFVFTSAADSGVGAAMDRITDFAAGDIIDLSGIDANTSKTGNQAFVWADSFTNVAGQATLTYDSHTKLTTLHLDVNGDGVADFELSINSQLNQNSGFIL